MDKSANDIYFNLGAIHKLRYAGGGGEGVEACVTDCYGGGGGVKSSVTLQKFPLKKSLRQMAECAHFFFHFSVCFFH